MAITDGTAGDWVATTTRNPTVTLPTHAAGDMLLVRIGWKSATPTTDVAVCNTSGWAKVGQFYDGGGASSNGGGGVLVAVFWKVATSSSETNPVIEFDDATAPTPGAYCAVTYTKDAADTWLTPVGDGGAFAASTSISATIQSHVSATAGDMVDAFSVVCDNNVMTVPTFTQSGLSLDTVTEYPATALNSGTSNDISADGCNRLATAGTSTAAAVVTGTQNVGDSGASWTTRLRVTSPVLGSFSASAVVKKTVDGSASAAAIVQKTQQFTFSADAFLAVTQSGSFSASAVILAAQTWTFDADAVALATSTWSLDADAVVLTPASFSFDGDAIVLAPQGFSFTASAIVLATQVDTSTADAVVLTPSTGTFEADSVVLATIDSSFTADAEIYQVPSSPVWTTPADTVSISATPSLAFTMPDMNGNLHFHMQLDKVDTFDGPDLRQYKSHFDPTGWEYWDGDSWEPVPEAGVPDTYAGNEARFNVSLPLSSGTWYRRVRAGT